MEHWCGTAFVCFLFKTWGEGREDGEIGMMHRVGNGGGAGGVFPRHSGTLETQG